MLAAGSWPVGGICLNSPGNLGNPPMYSKTLHFVTEFDASLKGCPMRFSRLSLALYAAALLSGCNSLRRQPALSGEHVRIPPVREGEFASERPSRGEANKADRDDANDRGPVKSIGWPGFRKRDAEAAQQPAKATESSSRNVPVTPVSGPLTSKLTRLFRASRAEECTDNCDGSPVFENSSPGAISEPALTPRGPSSIRADYGTPAPPKKPVPVPESSDIPESPRRPAATRPRVPPVVEEPQPQAPEPPEVPPIIVPRPPEPAASNSGAAQPDNSRPPLPDLLNEDPVEPPQLPQVPDMPVTPVPPLPVIPAEPPKPVTPSAPRSTQSAPKTKSTPKKTTGTPKNTEDDAVLEERLRQSAERMQSSGQRPSTRTRSTKPTTPENAPAGGDDSVEPPLWPKRFGGSPPVGEPVVEPLPEEQPAAAAPMPMPKPAPVKPAPAPLQEPAPVDPPAVPPAIPGLSPTIELDDEIPRPARPAPAAPATTSFRNRPGKSI